MFHTVFFYRAIYEIMWKNRVDPDRPQIKIWHISTACWIPKSTDTHTEYAIFIPFLLQQWLHKCVSILRYTYIACLVILQNYWVYSSMSLTLILLTCRIRWAPNNASRYEMGFNSAFKGLREIGSPFHCVMCWIRGVVSKECAKLPLD
jgi:hypothetical protein